MGLLTGIPLGVAQAAALPAGTRRRILWALAVPPLWALGWTVTTLVGVDVETRYTMFGSTGAILVSALSGLVLLPLLPRQRRGIGHCGPRRQGAVAAVVRRTP